MTNTLKHKLESAIYGAAIGDALGVPVEFCSREELAANAVTDMIGGGTYNMPAGTWSDDTSMNLCLIASIAQKHCIDCNDIMERFSDWLNYSKYTAGNKVFDVGMCCRKAIMSFWDGVPAVKCGQKSERDNGNGSLMRIAVLPFYLYQVYGKDFMSNAKAYKAIADVSKITHAHEVSVYACFLYCAIMSVIISEKADKASIMQAAQSEMADYLKSDPTYTEASKRFQRLFSESFATLPEAEIKSSGYVVDTLEAAVWCFLTTTTYEDCVLKAVNLGLDTDTVASVAGSIAGAWYGKVPEDWNQKLVNKELIESLINQYEAVDYCIVSVC